VWTFAQRRHVEFGRGVLVTRSSRSAPLLLVLFHSVMALSSEPGALEPAGAPLAENNIPIELRGNFPILVATVDGIDVPLKFDLGDASPLILQQGVLDQINAVPTGETSKFRGVNGVFESPLFKVARIQIGTMVFTDVVARLDVPEPTYQPGASGEKGYLGTGLLIAYELVVDYANRMMTLIPRTGNKGSSGSCAGTAVPFSPDWNGQPVTAADTDLGRMLLWWDTGSPVSAIRKAFVEKLRLPESEDTVVARSFILGNADFGPWQFDVWDMALPGFDGFIGYDFFARHVVCIDFTGNRLVIGR